MARKLVLEKPTIRDQALNLILDGKSDAQVANALKVSVTRQAITAFRHRHAVELQRRDEEVARRAEESGIASKVARIAAKDLRWQLLEQVRQQRAKGETGMETGLVVRQYKALGSGNSMQVVEEFKVDDGLLAAMERAEHSAAEELGHLPKLADTPTVNVALQVNLKWDDGSTV